jgi:hypothetical protein
MHKLAMLVSDSVVIDAGVFDGDGPQGRFLQQTWDGDEPHQRYRRSRFSYQAFLEAIDGLWEVEMECETPWIADGRRTLILKRVLPPVIHKSDLGRLEMVSDRRNADNVSVYRTDKGYFKESDSLTSMLMYHALSSAMGWRDMVLYRVYDRGNYAGFVMKDYGNVEPEDSSVSEQLFLNVLNWSLPLGMFPADVARQNIRMYGGQPVWIDVSLLGLQEMDAQAAIWATTNTYKQYDAIPTRARHAL